MTTRTLRPRYDVSIYDGQELVVKTMTRQQVMAINPQSFDHYISHAFGVWGFRTAQDEWVEHNGADWPGMGDVCMRLMQAIQINPGEFLDTVEISDLTGRLSLRDNNALSARLLSLRNMHKESYEEPNFFLSRKAGGFAIAWNPTKTWISIERIPPAAEVTE